MSQQELLKKVIRTLNRVGMQYMATGSLVSSLQGEPRASHDIDLVIAIQPFHAQALTAAFPPPEYYLDKESILDAMKDQGMFNLIDVREGDKIDFWILTDEPFDRSRFSRRYIEHVLGMEIQVSSPEDTILAKLRWAKLSGGSEKQLTDALRIYEVQHETIDEDYIRIWTNRLNVRSLWEELKDQAEIT